MHAHTFIHASCSQRKSCNKERQQKIARPCMGSVARLKLKCAYLKHAYCLPCTSRKCRAHITHTSHNTHLTSNIKHHPSCITEYTSHNKHHTSNNTHHTSYIIHHASYVIHHTLGVSVLPKRRQKVFYSTVKEGME